MKEFYDTCDSPCPRTSFAIRIKINLKRNKFNYFMPSKDIFKKIQFNAIALVLENASLAPRGAF